MKTIATIFAVLGIILTYTPASDHDSKPVFALTIKTGFMN